MKCLLTTGVASGDEAAPSDVAPPAIAAGVVTVYRFYDVGYAIDAGVVTVYRFYDVGYAIDLAAAEQCLATQAARRQVPAQGRQAASVEASQPPLRVDLGLMHVQLPSLPATGRLRASLYDLGAIALALDVDIIGPMEWDETAELLATCQDPPEELEERFEAALTQLEHTVRPAIERPERSAIVEDHTVLVIERLTGGTVRELAVHPLVRAALLGETRALSEDSSGLVTSLSYLPDDVALLSWGASVFADPEPLATVTAANLVEFANVTLLLLRSYDADLDSTLPGVNRRIAGTRRQFVLPLARRYSRLLSEVQELVLDITEVTERVDNALKVTDDVYWNRLYSAMIEVLRVEVWRQGVEHKLALLRDTYRMLHDEADAERAYALELAIVILIVIEILLAIPHQS